MRGVELTMPSFLVRMVANSWKDNRTFPKILRRGSFTECTSLSHQPPCQEEHLTMSLYLIPLEVNLAWSFSWSMLSHSGLLTDDHHVNNCWIFQSARLKVFTLSDQMVLQSLLLLIIQINAWKNSLVNKSLWTCRWVMREEVKVKMQMYTFVEEGLLHGNNGPGKSIPMWVRAGDNDTLSDGNGAIFFKHRPMHWHWQIRHFPSTFLTSRCQKMLLLLVSRNL